VGQFCILECVGGLGGESIPQRQLSHVGKLCDVGEFSVMGFVSHVGKQYDCGLQRAVGIHGDVGFDYRLDSISEHYD
jgi:hypothetical protein